MSSSTFDRFEDITDSVEAAKLAAHGAKKGATKASTKKKGARKEQPLHELLREPAAEPPAAEDPPERTTSEIFAQLKKSKDGSVDVNELRSALDRGIFKRSKEDPAEAWMAKYDADRSGALDKEEYRRLIVDIDAVIHELKLDIEIAELRVQQMEGKKAAKKSKS